MPPYEAIDMRNMMNFHLKNEDIHVLNVQKVPQTYSARYSAKQRTYTYRVIETSSSEDPGFENAFLADRVWFLHATTKPKLDLDLMREAASHLIGKELDMTSFVKVCSKQSLLIFREHHA
jgi:tRNA pseudouridine38-40 synthase